MTARTIIHFSDSAGFGGAEQALLLLLAGLDQQCWRRVLAYHESPGIAPLIEGAAKLDVELWPVPPMPEGSLGATRLPGFVAGLRRQHAHVFHAHQTWQRSCKYALFGAKLAAIPAIVATAQLLVDLPANRLEAIKQRVFSIGVGRYLAVSHDVAIHLARENGVPRRRIQVVHNAVAQQLPDAAHVRAIQAQLVGNDKRPVVLTLARLDKQKGLEYLIAAAAQTPDVRFIIAGDGPEHGALAELARSLGVDDRISFLGFRRDTSALLAICDLFVLPSLYEGLSLAVLEAMAAGKPVIASAIGGMDEAIMHGRTGLLVRPADPVALARAMRTLLANPDWAGQLAHAARDHARREFSAEAMVGRVVEIYDELLLPHEVCYASG